MICKCTAPIEIEVIDETSGRFACLACRKGVTVFKNDWGRWESAQERIDRMKVVQRCKGCGKNFEHYMDKCEVKRIFCDECLIARSTERHRIHRESRVKTESQPSKSPWRKTFNLTR